MNMKHQIVLSIPNKAMRIHKAYIINMNILYIAFNYNQIKQKSVMIKDSIYI